jgi:hypothetical protein
MILILIHLSISIQIVFQMKELFRYAMKFWKSKQLENHISHPLHEYEIV